MNSAGLSLGVLIQRFFQERLVRQQNASPNTIASYRDTWLLFLKYLTQEHGIAITALSMHDLTAETVIEFLEYLETHRGCKTRSRNQRLAALKSFFGYAVFVDPTILAEAERVLKLPTKSYDREVLGYLTKSEIESVLEVPDRKTAEGRRIYALLQFMYNTGARVSETAGVKAHDLTISKPTAYVLIHGKGNKDRSVPIWKETVGILTQLIAEQPVTEVPGAEIFRNSRGAPISRSGIAYLIHTTVEKAARDCVSLRGRKITPHTLRHTTAMHMLQSGVDINLIRMWLGHAKLDTTHQYIESDLQMKRKALEKGGIIRATTGPDWHPTDAISAFLNEL